MTDWIKHNGGPQPVADDVWVEVSWSSPYPIDVTDTADLIPWEGGSFRYRILNQHLIDAARLEGIRLGLEAAERHAKDVAEVITALQSGLLIAVPPLDPEAIAKEAQRD